MIDITFSSANFWYLLNLLQHKFMRIPSFIKDTRPFPSQPLQRSNNAQQMQEQTKVCDG